MSLATNILRRQGSAVYQLRLTVPADLQRARKAAGRPGGREVWKTLETRDPVEAKRRAPALAARIRAEWDAELAALASGDATTDQGRRTRHKPTQAEMEAVVWQMVAEDLARYDRDRRDSASSEFDRETRRHERMAIAGELRIGGRVERPSAVDMYGELVDALIHAKGWDVAPRSPEYFHLASTIRGARAATLDAMAARDQGRVDLPEANPQPPAPREPIKPSKPRLIKAKQGESLLELLPGYLAEEGAGAGLSPEQKTLNQRVVKLFAEFVGEAIAIDAIPQEAFQKFAQALRHYPKHAGVRRDVRGKRFNDAVEVNKRVSGPSIGTASRNNYLASLSAYFKWLYRSGYTSLRNVSDNLLAPINRRATSRDAFSESELGVIFSLPLFTGSQSNSDLMKVGDVRVNDWRFWIAVLCLYTGARLGEIAQMRTIDVSEQSGHRVFHITNEGAGMTVKTAGSVRYVPMHPRLVEIGFLEYHAATVRAGADRLFPQLKPSQYGRTSFMVSKFWTGYLKQNGIQGNAHQLRHTFTDALRRAGFMDAEIGPILGHSKGDTTGNYGNLAQVTMDRRAEMVAAVSYPTVSLSPPFPKGAASPKVEP